MRSVEEIVRDYEDDDEHSPLDVLFADRDAEWRRLVKEARAETKSWMERSIAIQKQEEVVEAERDRLKGELAAQQAHYDDQSLYSKEQYDRAEKIKGELAEARRLLMTAPLNVAADSLFAWMCARIVHLAGERHEHDSPPAEQAQGTKHAGHRWSAYGHTPTTGLLYCEDCRTSFSAGDVEAAEQAQGEGALAETDVHKQLQEASRLLGKHTRQIDALNKLTTHLGQSGALQADVVTLQNKVAALEARCAVCGWPARAIMHGDNTGPLNQHVFAPAPPPPEVAGPGLYVGSFETHEFSPSLTGGPWCMETKNQVTCMQERGSSIHAVTPIPEGK